MRNALALSLLALFPLGCLSAPDESMAPELAGSSDAALTGASVTNHGGSSMSSPAKLYYIFYGAWADPAEKQILIDFATSIGGSPFVTPFATAGATTAISYGGSTTDAYSQGTSLDDTKLRAIVKTAASGSLPFDTSGIYVVLTAPDVDLSFQGAQLCQDFCSEHDYATSGVSLLKYAFVGHPSRCYGACEPSLNLAPGPSPNDNAYIDAMIRLVSMELAATVVNPVGNGWYDNATGYEGAYLCMNQYDPIYIMANGSAANVRLGNRDYLLSQTFLHSGGGSCALDLSLPRHTSANQGKIYGDFNGDGRTDLLWRNTATGDVTEWLLSGSTVLSMPYVWSAVPIEWQIAGVADFNVDGKSDLLWRNVRTGDVTEWLMNGSTVLSMPSVQAGLSVDWVSQGVGDFDGDGKPDILWRNGKTGEIKEWRMNGSSITSQLTVSAAESLSNEIVGVGDFNADGRADILLFNPSLDAPEVLLMNGATITQRASIATPIVSASDIAAVADFTGDKKADIVIRDYGTFSLATMNGASLVSYTPIWSFVSMDWRIEGAGDVNKDGKADLLWRNIRTGDVGEWLMSGSTPLSMPTIWSGVPLTWQITRN